MKERFKKLLEEIYGPERVAEDEVGVILHDPFFAPNYETYFVPVGRAMVVVKKWGDSTDVWTITENQVKRVAGNGSIPVWALALYQLHINS
jgi:hypothetical protein